MPEYIGTANDEALITLKKAGDTFPRLALDSDGTIRQGNGAVVPLEKIPFPTSKWVSGQGNLQVIAVAANTMAAIPVELPVGSVITSLVVDCTTGAASSFVRVGVYADNGSRYPGSLLYDAGQLDTSSSGVKAATGLNIMTTTPVVWLAAVSQGGTPTMRNLAGIQYLNTFDGATSLAWFTPNTTGVSGALPTSFGGSIAGTTATMIAARIQ